mmetsp:Transcript_43044/g.119037  ORF Transcript_43044/g.119037 Transcript_43044/m.119037 type:complete len:183 (-) Transcript_43044:73-621(-)
MYRTYLAFQGAYPRLASMGTGLVVMGMGDSASQMVNSGSVDVCRSTVSSTYSGVVAPGIYHWWRALDGVWPGATAGSVARKVLINQAVLGPLNCALFLAWSNYAEAWVRKRNVDWGTLHQNTLDRLQTEVPDLCIKAASLWVPVHTVTFGLVPAHFRILFTSMVSVLWGGYLSHVANSEHAH